MATLREEEQTFSFSVKSQFSTLTKFLSPDASKNSKLGNGLESSGNNEEAEQTICQPEGARDASHQRATSGILTAGGEMSVLMR